LTPIEPADKILLSVPLERIDVQINEKWEGDMKKLLAALPLLGACFMYYPYYGYYYVPVYSVTWGWWGCF
jgi:hypothetical protein